jgi:GNAT superfamily N-acetyltransferase
VKVEWVYRSYRVTDDQAVVDLEVVHSLLSVSYWAAGRPKDLTKRAIQNSLCFSVLLEGKQVGFARVVTDYAVFAWIADVIIDPDHRGKGLGKFLIQCIQNHPEVPASLQMLRTQDAHGLYEKFGFKKGEVLQKQSRT